MSLTGIDVDKVKRLLALDTRQMNSTERAFCLKVRDSYNLLGESMSLSRKQSNWIIDILEKY